MALSDWLAAGREAEGQDLGLDVGGQEQKVHDLGQAGAGEAVVAGDVDVVAKIAGLDADLKVVGLGQQTGDTGGVGPPQAGLAACASRSTDPEARSGQREKI